MPISPAGDTIELRVDDVSQLFQTLDPFPFREKDLDQEAEDYIVGWARELPSTQPIVIVIHVSESKADARAAKDVRPAFEHYFNDRADSVQRDLNELFRVGRRSLLIGIIILALCLLIANVVSNYFNPRSQRLIEESFLILGWVANWRPLEIFLYDWWPLARRRNLYRRLAQADVRIVPYRAAVEEGRA